MADEKKVKREAVNYLWTALNWDFLRLLAEIAQYAAGKYGSAEQYTNARLEGEKSPINHAFEHITRYMAGEKHDRFGTLEHQLAAAAYNISMEYFDLKAHGFRQFMILAKQRRAARTPFDVMGDAANALEVAALADMPGPSEIADVSTTSKTDWAEGIMHFRDRWKDGLMGARDPGAARRWTAMLWVISQFEGVALTDEVVPTMIEELKAAAKEQLMALKTPENIEEQQSRLAALDTIRSKVPDLFPKGGS